MDRRAFLATARRALLLGGAAAVATALEACSAGTGTGAPAAKARVASLAELGAEPKAFQVGGQTLYAYREGETPVVLSARCTHQGCTVAWQGEAFVCPCHQGRYNRGGAVTGGPPPAPLARVAVTVESGEVVIA